ncbi:MAG: hypothetical protein HC802_20560 [Caldilineaceae bacterium]|nr:hypothetical protein [Caldilineaceae bacterium]
MLEPTAAYARFELAERLGTTVRALLSGQPGPLTAMEEYLWQRFWAARARIAQQNRTIKPSGQR